MKQLRRPRRNTSLLRAILQPVYRAVVALVTLHHAGMHLSALAELVYEPAATRDQTVLAIVLEDIVHALLVDVECLADCWIRLSWRDGLT